MKKFLPVLHTCGPCRNLATDTTLGVLSNNGPQTFFVCIHGGIENKKKLPIVLNLRGQKIPPEPPAWCPYQTEIG